MLSNISPFLTNSNLYCSEFISSPSISFTSQHTFESIKYFKFYLPKAGNYEKEKIIGKLKTWQAKQERFELVDYDTRPLEVQHRQLQEQLEQLKQQLADSRRVMFSGRVRYLLRL